MHDQPLARVDRDCMVSPEIVFPPAKTFQTVMASLMGVRLPCRHRAAIKFKLNPTPTNVTH